MPVLELETTGHRSGRPRSVLLTYVEEPGGPVVFGTNAGLDRDPAWVMNLRANANVRVRRNGTWVACIAQDVNDEAVRADLWARAVNANKGYADYLATLTRPVPIIQLRGQQ
jgi:deazaflavin-dependent oxidoreductase (nitroreductase family)